MLKKLTYLLFFLILCPPIFGQSSEEELIKLADKYFDEGQYGKAMPYYSQLLSLYPQNPRYNYKYGATALYGDASKKREAIKYLKYASTKSDLPPEVFYFLGRAYHLNYQFADAVAAYQNYLKFSGKKLFDEQHVNHQIQMCNNGKMLLSNIKEIIVLEKTPTTEKDFFRNYDLSDIGGRVVVTPEDLLTNLDKKNNHRSLVHVPGGQSEIYFASYGKESKTGKDIYKAYLLPGGKFSQPLKLSENINTDFDEDYPFMHPDGKTLFFSSKGHNSMGGYDIFMSRFDESKGDFGAPINMDFAINTPDDDIFYIADSLNDLATFASTRSSKQGELTVYKVKVDRIPAELVMVKGEFSSKINPKTKGANITVVDALTNEEVDKFYTDRESGEYVVAVPKSGKYKFIVKTEDGSQSHTEIIDIPAGSGMRAYLQEMELSMAGSIEKLKFTNKFNETWDGDVQALAQEILRKKAELDVNYSEEILARLDAQDDSAPIEIESAAVDAGFSHGSTPQSIEEDIRQKSIEFTNQAKEISKLKAASLATAENLNKDAENASKEASALLERSLQEENEFAANELLLRAAVKKFQAQRLAGAGENAIQLSRELQSQETLATELAENELVAADKIQKAISSDVYDEVFKELRSERERQDNRNKNFPTGVDAYETIRTEAVSQKTEADKLLQKARQMREDESEILSQLRNKRTLLESKKKKDDPILLREIEELEEEAKDADKQSIDLFNQALIVQNKAADISYQTELLKKLQEEGMALSPNEDFSEEVLVNLENDFERIVLGADQLAIDNQKIVQLAQENPQLFNELLNDEADRLAFRSAFSETAEDYLAGGEKLFNGENITKGDNVSETGSTQDVPEIAMETPEPANPDDIVENLKEEEIIEEEVAATSQEDPAQEIQDERSDAISSDQPENNTVSEPTQQEIAENNFVSPEDLNDGVENEEISSEENVEGSPEDANNVSPQEPMAEESEISTPEVIISSEREATEEKENIKINTDWLVILDEQIVALEEKMKSSSGNTTENQNQLEEFKRLRRQKQAEIDASENAILAWEQPEIEKGPVEEIKPLPETTDNNTTTASEAEIDPSTPAETEAITVSAPGMEGLNPQLQNTVRTLDETFVGRMKQIYESEIPLNEKILHKMELNLELLMANEKQIKRLEKKTQKGSPEDREEAMEDLNRLLAIKEIKERELDRDEKYYENPSDWAKAFPQPIQEEEEINIVEAPEVKEEPKNQYAFTNPVNETELAFLEQIYPGYEDQINNIFSNDLRPHEKLREKIALNEIVLNALNDSIQMKQLRLKKLSPGSAVHNDALSEINMFNGVKSARESEMYSDRLELNKLEQKYIEEHNSLIVEWVNPTYLVEKSAVEEADLSEEEKLELLLKLEKTTYSGIDIRVGTLINELDRTENDIKKDYLQLAIQGLLDLKEEKQQEIALLEDRIAGNTDLASDENPINDPIEKEVSPQPENTELETNDPKETTNTTEPIVDPGEDTNSTKVIQEKIPELNINFEVLQAEVDFSTNAYKSLNANLNVEVVKNETELLRNLQDEVRNDLEIYHNDSLSPNERSLAAERIKENIENINQKRLVLLSLIEKSNQDEISFFRSSNNQLRKEILDIGLSDEIHKSELTALDSMVGSSTDLLRESQAFREESKSIADPQLKYEKLFQAIEKEEQAMEILTQTNNQFEILHEKVAGQTLVETTPDPLISPDISSEENPTSEELEELLKEVTTPVLSTEIRQELSETEITTIKDNEPALQVPEITSTENEDQWLLEYNLPEVEISSSSAYENIKNYLLRKEYSDSLKVLSIAQNELAKSYLEKGDESLRQSQELVTEASQTTDIQEKEERINEAVLRKAEGVENIQKAEIAWRNQRDLQEKAEKAESENEALLQNMSVEERLQIDRAMAGEPITFTPEVTKGDVLLPMNQPEEKTSEEVESSENIPGIYVAENSQSSINGYNFKYSTVQSIPAVREMLVKHTFEIPATVTAPVFALTDKSVYSAEKPIPTNIKLPEGVVYQVQVGAFRNPIPDNSFGGITPVMAEKLSNGITRYKAGLFGNYEQAIIARDDIRSLGFSDAFVVVYIDGERSSHAVATIWTTRKTETAETGGTTETERTPAFVPKVIEPPVAMEDVDIPEGIIYQVQVGVFQNPNVRIDVGAVKPVMAERLESGITKIKAGLFTSYEDAVAGRDEVRSYGFGDAFVVVLRNGVQLPPSEARNYITPVSSPAPETPSQPEGSPEQEETTALEENDFVPNPANADYYNEPGAATAVQVEVIKGLFFTVQIGVYSKPVSADKLFNISPLNSELVQNGTIRYTTGIYNSAAAASERKNEIVRMGIADAFVIAYYNGKRITPGEAASLLRERGTAILSTNSN